MASKHLTYFKECENLEGRKEKTLIIDCSNCLIKEENIQLSRKCKFCFLINLYQNKNRKFDYISLFWDEILIKPNKFNLFLDYFKRLKKIKSINKKIENIRVQKCNYRDFSCKIIPNFPTLRKIKNDEYYDPLCIYDHSIRRYGILKKIKIIDSLCQECFANYERLEKLLMKLLSDLRIIKKFKDFHKNNADLQYHELLYEFIFSGKILLVENKKNDIYNKLKGKGNLISKYKTGEYEIFNVQIFRLSYENESIYTTNLFFQGEVNDDYYEKIILEAIKNIEIDEFDQLISLERLLEIYHNESIKYLNSNFNFSKNIRNKIGFITTLKKLNLDKLFPLLIDNFIEEIFLDSPNDEIYINHQKFGRCRTNISLNSRDIERIKTLFRLYSGKRLDFMNPTIKFVMKNNFFFCRFSIDVEPIQINNFALDIRKLNKNILTIQDLLKNQTLDPSIAAFLYFNVIRRKNITVTGETDTGKTTLINAFDLLTPKEFRKIYIENTIESLNQIIFGKHQLKYRVDALENSKNKNYSKSNQIKKLLHRTPDIIYLGEILTQEEAEAMFHCLAAGLRGFQTIHSKNIASLINRFLYHFKIDPLCLNDLDLMILMKKDQNERRVIGIFEICKNSGKNKALYDSLFIFRPELQNWINSKPLYKSNVIQELLDYEDLPEEKFNTFMKIYINIFEFLLKQSRLTNHELIEFFHKISYYSSRSIELLLQYWNMWKKNRSLNF